MEIPKKEITYTMTFTKEELLTSKSWDDYMDQYLKDIEYSLAFHKKQLDEICFEGSN